MATTETRTGSFEHSQFEALLFSLGTQEKFAINVFKAKELIPRREITVVPGQADGVRGVVSIRGEVLPVVDLPGLIGIQPKPEDEVLGLMVITEFAGQQLVMLVEKVLGISPVSWEQMIPSEKISGQSSGLVSAVIRMSENELASIVDVEQLVAKYTAAKPSAPDSHNRMFHGETVLFVDDSKVARDQVKKVLDELGVSTIEAIDGMEALARLRDINNSLRAQGGDIRDHIRAVITDIEMPRMDGYTLTRTLRADPALKSIPILIYSSLPTPMSETLGKSAGADIFIPKFDAGRLADGLAEIIPKEATHESLSQGH